MTNEEINKRLHEIMNRPYHDTENCSVPWCYRENIDFITSWAGFGILWEFMQKHERFWEFCNQYGDVCDEEKWLSIELISPPALAKVVYEFFEEAKP